MTDHRLLSNKLSAHDTPIARPSLAHQGRLRRLASLYQSSVGRKYVMALSGLAITGFVIVHLVGTLKLFLGREATNEYGEALRDLGEHLAPRTHVLWVFRIGLMLAFAVHLHAAFSLHLRNRRARGTTRYTNQKLVAATYASRTILWSGLIVGLFILFHLADLTWGATSSDFVAGEAYENQVRSFSNPFITSIYLLALAALTSHLYHGFWSLLQSIGLSTVLSEAARRRAAAGLAIAIGLGYASMPIAVLSRVIS